MPTIRVRDDGMTPNVKEGYEIPFQQGGYYVYEEVPSNIATYWNSLTKLQRAEIQARARKEAKDIREILESLV